MGGIFATKLLRRALRGPDCGHQMNVHHVKSWLVILQTVRSVNRRFMLGLRTSNAGQQCLVREQVADPSHVEKEAVALSCQTELAKPECSPNNIGNPAMLCLLAHHPLFKVSKRQDRRLFSTRNQPIAFNLHVSKDKVCQGTQGALSAD